MNFKIQCPVCLDILKKCAEGSSRGPFGKTMDFYDYCCHNKKCKVFDIQITLYKTWKEKE